MMCTKLVFNSYLCALRVPTLLSTMNVNIIIVNISGGVMDAIILFV